jgi:hypothetical protein
MNYTQSIKIDLSKEIVNLIIKKTKHKSLEDYVNDNLKTDLLKK